MNASAIAESRSSVDTAAAKPTAVFGTLIDNLQGMAYRGLNDSGRTMLFVSHGCSELTGYAAEELLRNGAVIWEELTLADDRVRIRREIAEALRDGRRFSVEYRIATRAGRVKWVVERGVAAIDECGGQVMEGFIEDASLRHTTLNALEQAELRYRHIFEHASEGIFQTTEDGRYVAANPALAMLYGYASPDDLIADLSDIERQLYVRESRREEFRRLMKTCDSVTDFESEVYRRDGSKIWISENAHVVRGANGDFICYEGTVCNITARMLAEKELRIAATAFESQEGMLVTDADTVILRVNRAFSEISGYAAEEVVGRTTRVLNAHRHDAEFYREMWQGIKRDGGWQGEIWGRRKNGEEYMKWLVISAVTDDAGAVTHYVGMHSDITERKKAEEKINELAFFDQLTGLPNRTLLLDRLKQAMTASSRNGCHGALLFIDLDNFKTLNDTLGHDMGDLLLKEVAQRLTLCVREGDTVARLGGDEFVVVLAGLSTSEGDAASGIEAVAEKILATLNRVYRFGGEAHQSTASIGATLFKGAMVPIDDLMKQADMTMYKAKEAGRNAVRFFDPAMELAVRQRAALETDLRRAVEAKKFVLHYQAQVAGGKVTGAEVLVRWTHPQRGMVSPAEFIPLAEETGLILPLGNWVLETACLQLTAWAAQSGMSDLTVAVNVSARQFSQPDFVEQVLAVLRNTGANPHRLKLELTESMLADNVQDIIGKMVSLKIHGIGFSLDDFGTGYSSLSYLKRLPLDQLKIDQSFVHDVMANANDAAIAKTVIALARNLGLGVIAEGVETEAQRDFLANSGCHACQGYFFSRPLPLEEFERFAQRPGDLRRQ